ncbi:MAG: hypothetical protein WDW38_009890 [Sanguina aurantia]
MACWTM